MKIESMSLRQLLNNGINMILHNLQLVLFRVPYYLLNYVLHGINKIFKSHLVLICPCPHYLYENEVVVLLCHFCTCHACKVS